MSIPARSVRRDTGTAGDSKLRRPGQAPPARDPELVPDATRVRAQPTTPTATMRIDIYLNYDGTCESAFRFYEEHLGGTMTGLTRHAAGPESGRLPEGWREKVLHARLQLGNAVLMGADIPGAEPMRSAYVTLTLETAEDAERVYALLADGGQVFMKLEETFFASRFAMLRDRFGTSWMLLHEHPARQGAGTGAGAAA